MIHSFKDWRAERLFNDERVPELVNVEDEARTRLMRLNAAQSLDDLAAIRGNRLEALKEIARGSTAFASTTSTESASRGINRKDQPISKSSTTTNAAKLTPIHPGKILFEDLRDEGITIDGLAQAIRVPANRISLIVNEKRSIRADTAARLARFFGTTPEYWLNLQNHYDLSCVDHEAIKRDVLPREAA